tara:strand:- start:62 stop:226 length:165 start_codon:yes stop_codon:yes gene_type:complete
MAIDPTKNPREEDQTTIMGIDNKKITCKDGFCYLPDSNSNQNLDNDSINIFDPI